MKSKIEDLIMRKVIMDAVERNKQKLEEIRLGFGKNFNTNKAGGEWKIIETEPLISADTFYKAQEVLKKRNA
ncbi:hypothetical protein AXX12_13380 [Anaerosporomusa subterranea]|uniref:Uncharacterized protein n=1 Tax=Anaerosporomusa subterranea TaxID=1794912 RepID=A0A154BMF7_ANASB|nr:hypothetical protein [Anaerosporomusa subterranea]KYZ75159.1 hypothetical protein AXX12_13380 [Anaerosporomusa subterranea]